MADDAETATATAAPIEGMRFHYGSRDREFCLHAAIEAKPKDHHRSPEDLVADARVFEAYLSEPLPEAAPAED